MLPPYPTERMVKLLHHLATAKPPVNASWQAHYQRTYENHALMRNLALAYSE